MNSIVKRNIIIAIALFFMFFFRFLQAPQGMTQDGFHVLGIFIGSLVLWLFVSIDWPSLLCILALSFVPSLKMNGILAGSLGNNTFAFLLFSFMCTYLLTKTTLIRRIAVGFISSKFARKGPWQFAFLFFSAIMFIGCFISPTVLFVVALPILEEVYTLFNLKKGDKFAAMLMMGLVCTTGIASGITPIGHVYGPLAMGFYEAATKQSINYVSYMVAAIPVGLITYLLMQTMFKFIYRPDTNDVKVVNVEQLKLKEPLTTKEIGILVIFIIVVLLWILPSIIKPFLPGIATAISSKTIAFPPLVGVIIMSILCWGGEPLMNFKDTMKNGVAWSPLIMCGGTLALGAAMTDKNVALTKYLSSVIAPMTSGLSPYIMVFAFVLWAAIQTNLSSNIVTITVVANIAIPILLSTNNAVSTPAVLSLVGMMGGFAFATPPAMPSVAIAGGSGWVTPITMMKYGFAVMFVAVIASVIIGYPIAVALMGY